MNKQPSIATSQRGSVIVVVAIGLVAIIGIAGLAIDMSHAYLNKSRLQNALDSAALSAARILNEGSTVATASMAGSDTFSQHLVGEMADANPELTFEYSQTLVPFTPGAIEPQARYVRARIDNFQMEYWFVHILPAIAANQTVTGSAVAGPSPPLGTGEDGEVCDIAPLLVCGSPGDTDCSDGSCYGYDVNTEDELVLKTNSSNSKNWEIGPGNFQLIQLDCGPGGSCVRGNLAGEYSGCIRNDETVTTEPGNTVGPTAQGFNTRFGMYQGPVSISEYPPDVVTFNSDGFWYDDYLDRLENGPHDYTPISEGGLGVRKRRILAIVFGDCSTTVNGRGDVPVLGLGCFFMTRPTSHSGNTQTIYGQLIDSCEASGGFGEDPPGPGTGPVLYKIILYKDPDRIDS